MTGLRTSSTADECEADAADLELSGVVTRDVDWPGEVFYLITQVFYLVLQNYNISRLLDCNVYLIGLTLLVFSQRLWTNVAATRGLVPGNTNGMRFTRGMLHLAVYLNGGFCAYMLSKDSLTNAVAVGLPLIASFGFYRFFLGRGGYVWTFELSRMLLRCLYHSLEAAYFVLLLPQHFRLHDYYFYSPSRCAVVACYAAVHVLFSRLLLEAHVLGPEVELLSQLLGQWDEVSYPGHAKGRPRPPSIWSPAAAPYPFGTVVRHRGRYYRASSNLNSAWPHSSGLFCRAMSVFFGDLERMRVFVSLAIFASAFTLVQLMAGSRHWPMYALLLVPDCAHFIWARRYPMQSSWEPRWNPGGSADALASGRRSHAGEEPKADEPPEGGATPSPSPHAAPLKGPSAAAVRGSSCPKDKEKEKDKKKKKQSAGKHGRKSGKD